MSQKKQYAKEDNLFFCMLIEYQNMSYKYSILDIFVCFCIIYRHIRPMLHFVSLLHIYYCSWLLIIELNPKEDEWKAKLFLLMCYGLTSWQLNAGDHWENAFTKGSCIYRLIHIMRSVFRQRKTFCYTILLINSPFGYFLFIREIKTYNVCDKIYCMLSFSILLDLINMSQIDYKK